MARLAGAAGAVALALTVAACGGTDPQPRLSEPSLTAEIVQLRRDQVLERVEIALKNTGGEQVVVERLRVRIPGFDTPRAIPKKSPIPAGQVVNLPWPYGTVRCPVEGTPSVGRPVVTLRIHTESDPVSRPVRFVANDQRGLLAAIALRACTVAQVAREVELRFGDDWRVEREADRVIIHGTLEARLLIDEPRTVTQIAGAILYGLRPDESVAPAQDPLAALTPSAPGTSIPVVAFAARCDGHTIGEIKKPYEFLVWVGAPGREPIAVTPEVDDPTKEALREVCAF